MISGQGFRTRTENCGISSSLFPHAASGKRPLAVLLPLASSSHSHLGMQRFLPLPTSDAASLTSRRAIETLADDASDATYALCRERCSVTVQQPSCLLFPCHQSYQVHTQCRVSTACSPPDVATRSSLHRHGHCPHCGGHHNPGLLARTRSPGPYYFSRPPSGSGPLALSAQTLTPARPIVRPTVTIGAFPSITLYTSSPTHSTPTPTPYSTPQKS